MTQSFRFKLNEFLKIPEERKLNKIKRESPKTLESLAKSVLNRIPLPEAFSWSVMDVCHWISMLGFPEYKITFEENFIDGRKLIQIDSSSLVRMNIHNFNDIKKITAGIRNLYKIEIEQDKRLSHLPYCPETLFKFYKSLSGKKIDNTSRSEFFEMLKVTNRDKIDLNHFERLYKKLQHVPEFKEFRVGKTSSKLKLNEVRNISSTTLSSVNSKASECPKTKLKTTMNYEWTEKELRQPWRLHLLSKLEQENEK